MHQYAHVSVCTGHLYVSFLEITIKLVFSKQQVDCPTLPMLYSLPLEGTEYILLREATKLCEPQQSVSEACCAVQQPRDTGNPQQ